MPAMPFVEARLVNIKKPLNVRRYIVFHVWDALQGKLIRKRDYEVNNQKSITAQKDFAKRRIREINKLLMDGYHVNSKKHKEQTTTVINFRRDYSIEEAFKAIIPIVQSTKRKTTYDSYHSVANIFLKFCKANQWEKWKIKTLEKTDVLSFIDHLQSLGKINNCTRNSYLGYLKSMFTMMITRKLLDTNPAIGIPLEPEDAGRNIAYGEDQIKGLKEALQEKDPRLWLFVQFMFYGFIRPLEISKLRVSMFDLANDVILLPASISKNRKARHVRISAPFRTVVDQLHLELYRPNDFVFGYNLQSGAVGLQKNRATHAHTKVVRDLKYGPDYTLYSWKHTGVVQHYKAGVDIKSIQQQVGHSSLDETNRYLKSLGLLADKAAFDNSPQI